MINVCLLGATGSIGTQTIEVIQGLKDYKIVSMSCNNNTLKLSGLITCDVTDICVGDNADTSALFTNINIHKGKDGIKELINDENVDVVVNALVGSVGLFATVEAIKAHKKVLLANKESLVLAGDIINNLLKDYDGTLYPIDSEHSALWQCLNNVKREEVSKLIITASGGALRDKSRDDLNSVTVKECLEHPTWDMGGKVTIDSATMVNKALEVIEAHHLFGFDYDDIVTVLHPESKVHAAIRTIDGATIMHAAQTSMKLPISYALTYPERCKNNIDEFKLEDTFNLTFKEMDYKRFPMLKLGYEVAKMGGIMPCVFSTANEVAVEKFLNGEIKFLEIEDIITKVCDDYKSKNIICPTLDDIYKTIEDIKNNY